MSKVGMMDVPTPDAKLRQFLHAVRQNIDILFGIPGRMGERACTLDDLKNAALATYTDAGRLARRPTGTTEQAGQTARGRNSDERVIKAVFDATSGIAVGTHTICTLPAHAIVTEAWYDVVESFSAGTVLRCGIENGNAGAFAPYSASGGSQWTVGVHATPANGEPGTFIPKTAGDAGIQVEVSVAGLTTGRLNMFVRYVISE